MARKAAPVPHQHSPRATSHHNQYTRSSLIGVLYSLFGLSSG